MNELVTNPVRHNMLNRIRLLAGGVTCLLLSACASTVMVVADIPTPLVEKVPLSVHLSYTDEFKNHVYIESEKKRVLSSINFSDAQAELFDSVFGQLTTLVAQDDVTRDLIIEPEILDFQYTAPHETKLKQYEVWVKYRLKILKPDASNLADWTVKGYGKTPTAMLTSASRAFNSATNIALRDVGAQLATRFSGQRSIRELIASKRDPQQIQNADVAENIPNGLSQPNPPMVDADEEADDE